MPSPKPLGGISPNLLHDFPLWFCQVRWSLYDSSFMNPTISQEELQKPLKPDDPRKFMRIKAARTDDTTLADYDPIIQKFTSIVMKKGNKTVARNIMAKALENIKHVQVEKYHKSDEATKPTIELNPVNIFHQALENAKPLVMTKRIKRGGSTYQVPMPCPPNVQTFKSMNWLIECSKLKERNTRMYDSLAKEILAAYNNKGKTIQKKLEMHKLCEANKAYAHYRS